ncbi:MAG: glycosyltransferase, partial [Desulfobacterales bacterium]
RVFLQKQDFDIVHVQHLLGLSANWVDIAKEAGLPVLMKLDDMYLYCRQGHLMDKNQSYCSGPDSLDKCYECTSGVKSSDDPEYIASIFYYLALRREVLQRMFQQVDFVHTPSHFLKDTCVANNLNNLEFHVIPTGISPFEIQKRKKKRGVVRIGFMGEIDVRKGIGIFLDAIERANSKLTTKKQASLEFKIYGRHFNNDLYHSMCAKVNDFQNATYLGSFSPEERHRILSEIDLLVMPSLGENYPFVLREALYAGLPALASAIAGVPEIIIDGENGFLIPPGDAEALADIC